MAAIAALRAQALFAERQVKVVKHNQQIFFRDVFFLQPVAHRFAAAVHVGRGLQQDEGSPFMLQRGNGAKVIGFKGDIGSFGQSIQHLEAYIVAGIFVFRADVAQTGNQIFHGIGFAFFRKKNLNESFEHT